MKHFIISLLSILCWNMSVAQMTRIEKIRSQREFPKTKYEYQGSKLDSIEKRLKQGNIKGLYEIAAFLDSDTLVGESLGYHSLRTPEKEIAKRLIKENSIFLEDEFKLDEQTSSKTFLAFLQANEHKIIFSEDAKAFLITPLINRTVKYEIRGLTGIISAALKKSADQLQAPDWIKENHIDSLISHKNPLALFKIASECYKSRSRFDHYQFDPEQYILLLQLLTGIDIGVEDEKHEISHHVDKDFDPASRLSLLIYFTKNYPFYKWNDTLKEFSDHTTLIQPINKENNYFEALHSKDDAVALNAFIKLTTCPPANVSALNKEYSDADVNYNYSLPTFPYQFLQQLSLLTEYCTHHYINFKGSYELTENIKKLKEDMTFYDRRQLEDKMISTLTVDEITAFEYWSLIYQQSFPLTYSAGRILDVFYSKNWNKIIGDKQQLDLYLKKSKLFNRLGIIGICNNYLTKFTNVNLATVHLLHDYTSDDTDITEQAKAAVIIFLHPPKEDSSKVNRESEADYNTHVENLEQAFSMIIKSDTTEAIKNRKITSLLSKINYNQLGKALSLIETRKFNGDWDKYSFIQRDFGFYTVDLMEPANRAAFISYYNNHTENEVYTYYLAKGGINYTHPDHSLDFDKIYEILKYDVVTAFVGGGGGKMDNEVYAVIKLLELKFNTRLGFPEKLCCSDNMYGCYSADRAKEWMNYLVDMGLLKMPHFEPVSFHFK
jgi:hypothetical protein